MRPAQRFVKVFVALVLILLLSTDISLACRLFTACCPPPPCQRVVYCCPPPPVCTPVHHHRPVCCPPTYVDPCGRVVDHADAGSAAAVESQPTPSPTMPPSSQPVADEELPAQPVVDAPPAQPDAEPAEFVEEEPALPVEPDADPLETDQTPADLPNDIPELPAE
ncbi:MAG: hypothetical protein GTO03_00250, partial [Planctomycetales bacterium]|nr:hypothetical protein [Planctomycetales bacterium]